MNEVTRIHLGRQPFTISVEAHEALKGYLADIKKQLGNDSTNVIDEIELRMAELLAERGITGEKVVLVADIDFLKEQLGAPKDFVEPDDGEAPAGHEDQTAKRLFRDTENGMVAGVAAGLAEYFGIDVLPVRLIFIVAIITGGWGVVLYLLLWLLVPEAKTPSERLQMQGVRVTVDSLKTMVERADVEGAAKRVNRTIAPLFSALFMLIAKIVGLSLILAGLGIIFGAVFTKAYLYLHDGKLFQEGIFPVGSAETLLVNLGLIMAGLTALFVILAGVTPFTKKWPVNGWVTGMLVGTFIIGLAATTALTADAVPKVRGRYESAIHTTIRELQPFSGVTILGDNVRVDYQYSNAYSVELRYPERPDVSNIKTTVTDGELTINSQGFENNRNCQMLCLFPHYDVIVTVNSPTVTKQNSFDYRPDWEPWSDYYPAPLPSVRQ